MTIIVNVLGNDYIQSDIIDSITVKNILGVCRDFAGKNYTMPEEIFIIASGELIEIDVESVLQSELEKQLQG